KLGGAATSFLVEPGGLPVLVHRAFGGLGYDVGDTDDAGLLDAALLLRGRLLLVLGHLLEQGVSIGLGGLESLWLPAEGLVRKVLLVVFASVGNSDVESVVFLLWLVDAGNTVIRA